MDDPKRDAAMLQKGTLVPIAPDRKEAIRRRIVEEARKVGSAQRRRLRWPRAAGGVRFALLALAVTATALILVPHIINLSSAKRGIVWAPFERAVKAFGTDRVAMPVLPFTPSRIEAHEGMGPIDQLLTADFFDQRHGGLIRLNEYDGVMAPVPQGSYPWHYVSLKWGIQGIYQDIKGVQSIAWLYRGIEGDVSSAIGTLNRQSGNIVARAPWLSESQLAAIANSTIPHRPPGGSRRELTAHWAEFATMGFHLPVLPFVATSVYSYVTQGPGTTSTFVGTFYNEQSLQFALLTLQTSRRANPDTLVGRDIQTVFLKDAVPATLYENRGMKILEYWYRGVEFEIQVGRGKMVEGPLTVKPYMSIAQLAAVANSMLP